MVAKQVLGGGAGFVVLLAAVYFGLTWDPRWEVRHKHACELTEQPPAFGNKAANEVSDSCSATSGEAYLRNKQGLWLYNHHWLPSFDHHDQLSGIVFIVHGYGEHSDRYSYRNVAQLLTENGYAVFGMDHQGLGKSQGDRAFVEKFSDFVDDYELFINNVTAEWDPNHQLPHFVLGHSMGGAISLLLGLRNATRFKGMILSGPAIEDTKGNVVLYTIVDALSFWVPKISVFSLSPENVSRNKTAVRLFLSDPLIPRTGLRAHVLNEFFKTFAFIQERTAEVTWPYLLLHGEADGTCSVESSRRFHERTGSKDKTLLTFPGMRHGLFEDPERELVFSRMVDWLTTHK